MGLRGQQRSKMGEYIIKRGSVFGWAEDVTGPRGVYWISGGWGWMRE